MLFLYSKFKGKTLYSDFDMVYTDFDQKIAPLFLGLEYNCFRHSSQNSYVGYYIPIEQTKKIRLGVSSGENQLGCAFSLMGIRNLSKVNLLLQNCSNYFTADIDSLISADYARLIKIEEIR